MEQHPTESSFIRFNGKIWAHTSDAERVDFYKKTQGKKYDFIGLMSPVLGNLHDDNKYFCSEWCAEAIGLISPNKYSPCSLYRYLKKML